VDSLESNLSYEEVQGKKPSIFGVITSPSQQFERMKEEAPMGMPLIIMMLLMAVTGALVSFISLNNPLLTNPELMPTDFKIPVGLTVGVGAGGALVGGTIMFFIVAAFYKVCMIIMGNDTTYKKVLVIVIYANIISTIGLLANALIALVLGGYEATYTSLAPLFTDNQVLHTIASNFDIFKIWYYIVLGLGLHIVAGLSKNKAITLVLIIFIVSVGLSSFGGFIPKPGL
jgi:hypothetical protein